MNLPLEVKEMLPRMFARFGKASADDVAKDPEACVIALLYAIEKDLPEVSATLRFTVETAAYEGNLQKARELLDRAEQPLAAK